MKYFNEGQGKMCKALSIRIKQKAIKNEYTGKKRWLVALVRHKSDRYNVLSTP